MFAGMPSARSLNLSLVLALALSTSALAADKAQPPDASAEKAAIEPEAGAGAEIKGVLTQPVDDFNLTRTEIPPELLPIEADPYGPPKGPRCADLTAEIALIDHLLGEDLMKKEAPADTSLLTKDNAAKAARNTARSAASSWIPFRGLVREVTGAESHARAFKEAVLAGMVRRACLKGVREMRRCPIPAAVRPAATALAGAR